jgi:hypothetical protein
MPPPRPARFGLFWEALGFEKTKLGSLASWNGQLGSVVVGMAIGY